MARPDKAAAVAEIADHFRDSNAAVLTEYRGLTVAQLKELRRALGATTQYAVVKNTLTKVAAREAGIDGLDESALDLANTRLAGRESFLVDGGGQLGLYVVGRLAERLGAVVRLSPAPVHGVAATVALPSALLADGGRPVPAGGGGG